MPLSSSTSAGRPTGPSARSFLVRGLLAGLLAGFLAFGVAYVVGEPAVRAAIAIEESGAAHDAAATAGHGAPTEEVSGTVVPRALQSTLGLLSATTLVGVTLGGLVGVLSALALGRLGGWGPRASTLAVAAIGFVAVFALPFAVYPPNPPAVGVPETLGLRTALYFILVAISVVAAVTALLAGRRLAHSWGGWYAGIAAAAGYLVVTLVAAGLLPTYDEVPANFPASLLYRHRLASFVTQLTLWAVLGLTLAELVHRLVARDTGPVRRPVEPARTPG